MYELRVKFEKTLTVNRNFCFFKTLKLYAFKYAYALRDLAYEFNKTLHRKRSHFNDSVAVWPTYCGPSMHKLTQLRSQ